MNIIVLIVGVLLWNIIGFFFCSFEAMLMDADGFEFFNPRWLYHRHKRVNVFGALVLCLFFTALCPAYAVFYWFYKLCTMGRK
jgi:hypothetical protein